jgi:uncharacterized protein (TIGR02118 family)
MLQVGRVALLLCEQFNGIRIGEKAFSDSLLRPAVFLAIAHKIGSCNYNSCCAVKRTFKELAMAGVKLMVMYPRPKDVDAFEKVYQKEHVPMAVEKLKGKTKLVATKVTASPQGTAPFYRIAEVHFPSMEALQACAASEGGKETIGHAMKISSGGPPVIMIAEEDSFNF